MNGHPSALEPASGKPIVLGVTCWRWQWTRPRAIAKLAARLEVNLQLTERIHGLNREIECQVSGKNVDRFIGEFIRLV